VTSFHTSSLAANKGTRHFSVRILPSERPKVRHWTIIWWTSSCETGAVASNKAKTLKSQNGEKINSINPIAFVDTERSDSHFFRTKNHDSDFQCRFFK
jgi:hypothetical protein